MTEQNTQQKDGLRVVDDIFKTALFPYLEAAAVPAGQDYAVTIKETYEGPIWGPGGVSVKTFVAFEETDKILILNKSNAVTIWNLHGRFPPQWKGKRVALYRTQVQVRGENRDAIRIRPTIPPAKTNGAGAGAGGKK